MKDCIVVVANRDLHLKRFDPTILSRVSDVYKVLIISHMIADSVTEADRECYDEIRYVTVIPEGVYKLYYNREELIDIIRPLTERFSPENVVIFSIDEFNLEEIAEITSSLGAQGYKNEKVDFFRDKVLMKSYLKQHSNVILPEHVLLHSMASYEDLVKQVGSTFVVKPVDSAGAEGISIIRTKKEWEDLRRLREDNFSGYEAETFLSGQLFHVDSVRVNGKIIAKCISEYLHPVGDFVDGKPIGSILLLDGHPAYSSLEALNKEVLDAFDEDGCFHMECFWEEGSDPVFLEIGWRQSGSPSDRNFKQIYANYSQTLVFILAYFGCPIPDPDPFAFQTMGFIVTKQKGVFKGLSFPEIESDVDVDLKIDLGEEILEPPKIIFELAASFTVSNPSYESLYQDFLRLRDSDSIYKRDG